MTATKARRTRARRRPAHIGAPVPHAAPITGHATPVPASHTATVVMVGAMWATIVRHTGLIAVLLLAAGLDLWQLDRAGYANLYYTVAVKSMLANPHAFFFASFDPLGFVTVDKPPLGFWIQALSARLLGFSPFSLALPQAVAGVLAVGVLYLLIRRVAGTMPAVLAAATLAVTPISVVTARNNTIDSLLVLILLLAAWAVAVATERGSVRFLALGAALVGLGFNVKMLDAYLVVPALGLTYLVGAPLSWRRRLAHLGVAALVVGAISLSWATAVDLTPPAARPYVGGSATNSVLDLVVGHNGLSVLRGMRYASAGTGSHPHTPVPPAPHAIGYDSGPLGPLRLLDHDLAGQIGWLLPLAVLGLIVAALRDWADRCGGRRRHGLALWGGWFITTVIFFSVVGFCHPYYLVILAPALAAVVGLGAAALWRDYQDRTRWGWLLPIALVGTAAVQVAILAPFPAWGYWLIPSLAAACLVAATVLTAARLRPASRTMTGIQRLAVTVGMLALLSAPLTWSLMSVAYNRAATFPIAGPDALGLPSTAPPHADAALLNFLLSNADGTRFLVAVPDAGLAAPLMLLTDQPVMTYGGFMGRDRILNPAQLSARIEDGDVRFVMTPLVPQSAAAQEAQGLTPLPEDPVDGWVRNRCAPVPPPQWLSGPLGPGGTIVPVPGSLVLYDCGAPHS